MHDLVIRGGTVVDGTGEPAVAADVAVDDGRITAGRPRRRRTPPRRSTPPACSSRPASSTSTRTTTARSPGTRCSRRRRGTASPPIVMGNCGVGFAPVRPDQHDWLIGLMEGVEDIPGAALAEGIRWGWETFPEYLDFLDAQPLRARRRHAGAARRRARLRDGRARRAQRARDARRHRGDGARSCARASRPARSASRRRARSRTARSTASRCPARSRPRTSCSRSGARSARSDAGVFELAPAGVMGEDLAAPSREMDWMRRLAAETGRPVTFAMLQHDLDPDQWKRMLDLALDGARRAACRSGPQVAGAAARAAARAADRSTRSRDRPSYQAIDAPAARRARRAPARPRACGRDPRRSRRDPTTSWRSSASGSTASSRSATRPTTSPRPTRASRRAPSARVATRPRSSTTCLLAHDGRELLLRPLLGYSRLHADPIREMVLHPATALGLGDGGAHCGAICDASIATYMLTHWVRDRSRGERLPLELRGAQDDERHRLALRARRPRRARRPARRPTST